VNRLTPEQQSKVKAMRKFIHSNLFDPPFEFLPPADINMNEFISEKGSDLLPVPQFRKIRRTNYDKNISKQFCKQYEKGLLRSNLVDPDLSGGANERLRPNQTPRPNQKLQPNIRKRFQPPKHTFGRILHRILWTKEELTFFRELHCIYGNDWRSISRLMCNVKSATNLRKTFKDARGCLDELHVKTFTDFSIACGVCKISCSRDKYVIFCDCCYRSYHWRCLDPPMKLTPPQEWYCCEECRNVYSQVGF